MWSIIFNPVFELFQGSVRSRALFDLKHLTQCQWQVSSSIPIVLDLACLRVAASCSWLACSRISESVGKTRKKVVQKVGRARKRKKEGTESSPLPVSSRFILVFALSQFSPPNCLGAWNRLVAGGIVMPGVLSRRLSCHMRRAPSAEAARKISWLSASSLLSIADTETTALVRLSPQLLKLAS